MRLKITNIFLVPALIALLGLALLVLRRQRHA
jgi:MYXO-CTERM domain-containing protein